MGSERPEIERAKEGGDGGSRPDISGLWLMPVVLSVALLAFRWLKVPGPVETPAEIRT